MIHEINLMDYLPAFIQEYDEIKKIMAAENSEFQALWEKAGQVKNNLFVVTADEAGIKKFENVFNIKTDSIKNIDSKRTYIINQLLIKAPFSIGFLREMLNRIIGINAFDISMENNYLLKITSNSDNLSCVKEIHDLLDKIKPANITHNITIRLNRDLNTSIYTATIPSVYKSYNINVMESEIIHKTTTNVYTNSQNSIRKAYHIILN